MFRDAEGQAYLGGNSRSPIGSKGLTLLEVLIALLVLSVGLIGVAVLTVQSVQHVHSSLLHSIASVAALDFEERLWLKLATTSSGCPTTTGAFETDFQNHWGGVGANGSGDGGALPLFLPGFKVDVDFDDTDNSDSAAPDMRTFSLVLEWAEERFSTDRFGATGQRGESASFRISILCRDA